MSSPLFVAPRRLDREVELVPGMAAVHRDMHQAVVASDGQLYKMPRVLSEGGQGSKRHVAGDSALGQVVAQRFPIVALIQRSMDLVGAHVQHVLLVLAQQDGCLPIPSQRRFPKCVHGVEAHGLARSAVGALVPTKLVACVHHLVVARVDFNLHAVAPTKALVSIGPRLVPPDRFAVVTRSHPGAVVLQPAVNAVRFRIVHFDGIKLPHGGAVAFDPRISAIPADVDAPVVSVDEVIAVAGVDPNFVMIHVNVGCADGCKGLACIS